MWHKVATVENTETGSPLGAADKVSGASLRILGAGEAATSPGQVNAQGLPAGRSWKWQLAFAAETHCLFAISDPVRLLLDFEQLPGIQAAFVAKKCRGIAGVPAITELGKPLGPAPFVVSQANATKQGEGLAVKLTLRAYLQRAQVRRQRRHLADGLDVDIMPHNHGAAVGTYSEDCDAGLEGDRSAAIGTVVGGVHRRQRSELTKSPEVTSEV